MFDTNEDIMVELIYYLNEIPLDQKRIKGEKEVSDIADDIVSAFTFCMNATDDELLAVESWDEEKSCYYNYLYIRMVKSLARRMIRWREKNDDSMEMTELASWMDVDA